MPAGFEDLHSEDDLVAALCELRRARPGIRRAVVKLDESFSGEGNALFRYPEAEGRVALRDALAHLSFAVASETRTKYLGKFTEMGGIVEEFLEYPESVSPSVQLRIDPQGEVVLLSTHDQILGGPSNQVYQGCRFPAEAPYRRQIQEAARKVGRRARAAAASSAGSASTSSSAGGRAASPRSSPSRSTCAWAARRTRSSRCSS